MSSLIDITDPRVVKAYAHPLRIRILELLEGRVASPRELASALDEPLSNTSYHTRQLAALGLVELVRETQSRGAVEHHYTAKARPTVTDETWALLPTIVKRGTVGGWLNQGVRDLVAAVENGGLDRGDVHFTHTSGRLDERGWKQVSDVLKQALGQIDRVLTETEARVASDPDAEARAERSTVMIMHFANPDPVESAKPPAGLDEVRFRMRAVASQAGENGAEGGG